MPADAGRLPKQDFKRFVMVTCRSRPGNVPMRSALEKLIGTASKYL
jgi:hypothetical protein